MTSFALTVLPSTLLLVISCTAFSTELNSAYRNIDLNITSNYLPLNLSGEDSTDRFGELDNDPLRNQGRWLEDIERIFERLDQGREQGSGGPNLDVRDDRKEDGMPEVLKELEHFLSRHRRDAPSSSGRANVPLPKPDSMPGLIIAHGYPAEVHHVTTKDGYILEMHRISGPRMINTSPKKKKSRVPRRGKRRRKRSDEAVQSSERKRNNLRVNGERRELQKKTKRFVEDPTLTRVTRSGNSQSYGTIGSRNMRFNDFPTNQQGKLSSLSRRRRQTKDGRGNDYRRRVSRQRELIRSVDPRMLVRMTRRRNTASRRRKLLVGVGPMDRDASKRSINGRGTPNTLLTGFGEETKGAKCLEDGRNCGEGGITAAVNVFTINDGGGSSTIRNSSEYRVNVPTSSGDRSQAVNRKVVFIQHCLQCSSADFVLNDHNQALAFVLADAGYDVWLGNFRGNQYSRKHERLSPDDVNFWKFKVDEMAKYDLPAMVDYVLRATKVPKINFIGHSLGTMTYFMAASTYQDFRNKINMMVALAPAAYLDHMKGGLRLLLKTAQEIYRALEYVGVAEMGGVVPWREGLIRRLCHPSSPLAVFCSALLPTISGRNTGLNDREYLPMLLANFPSGTSIRTMAQIGQMIGSDGLQKFDFGSPASNMARYGSFAPPHYRLENIDTPVAIMWTENDYIVTPKDVARAVKRLPNVILNYKVPHATFNHVDFLFAEVAKELVYDPIIELLRAYN